MRERYNQIKYKITQDPGITEEFLAYLNSMSDRRTGNETGHDPKTHFPKTGRNDPCPCGSGKKYKKCCQ